MSQVHRRGAVTPEMNITPLIDVVFLLIVFFMLASNFAGEENVEMWIPQLEDPQVRELEDIDRVVVNVAPEVGPLAARENPLEYPGTATRVKVGMQWLDADNLRGISEEIAQIKERKPDVEVLLRADAALYYSEVQPIMTAITSAGVEKVHLVAAADE